MFEHLRFRYQLAKELRAHRKIDVAFDEEIKIAKAMNKSPSDLRAIEERRRWELEMSTDEIGVLSSRYWLDRAHDYQVGVPNDWKMSDQLGQGYLSTAATQKIRADIRAEQKATWEYWQSRVALVLSIFGSVIGVLAYMKK